MGIKVGINGFGRIGRNIMRAAMGTGQLDFVAVNDLTDTATLAHLLKYDSILGNLDADVQSGSDWISVNGDKFQVLAEKDPAALPWGPLGVELVFEGTGRFTARADAAKHIAGGAKRVVITAPSTGPDATLLMGVRRELRSGPRTPSCPTPRAPPTVSRRSSRCSMSTSASSTAG